MARADCPSAAMLADASRSGPHALQCVGMPLALAGAHAAWSAVQHLEDCGPIHNNCDGGSYMDEDYNAPGWY